MKTELITCTGPPKSAESIRNAFNRKNIEPVDKAMEKGADYVRAFYNGPALRKRAKLEMEIEK